MKYVKIPVDTAELVAGLLEEVIEKDDTLATDPDGIVPAVLADLEAAIENAS